VNSISHLKCEKQHGIDTLINAHMIKGYTTIAPIVCTLFNGRFSGRFPIKWEEDCIVPSHTQVDETDVNNSRGVKLMRCVPKDNACALNKIVRAKR
jgi:hypothetical protein